MTMSAVVGKNMSLAGKSFNQAQTLTGEAAIVRESSLAAAKGGNLSTRTDNDTGTLTMDSGGHGITTGARLDVYWNVAGVKGCRRGMTVGTVSGTSVPIDGGAGDNLPAQASDIAAMVPEEDDFALTGNDVSVILAYFTRRGIIVFADSSDVELHSIVMPTDGAAYEWWSGSGVTNPLAGDAVAKIFRSHAYEDAAAVLRVGCLID